MKKICMLFYMAIAMNMLSAEPQETAGELSKAPNTQEDSAPDVSLPTPQQESASSGLLGSQPLTPANQIAGAPLDDMLENVNESNTALKSAMSFARDGDYESALQLFAQSCDQGNAAGCFGSGLIYMYGANSGVPEPQKAVNYYYKACVGGDAVACANLAMAYDNGQGVKEDKDQAAQLYEVACQGGDSRSPQ